MQPTHSTNYEPEAQDDGGLAQLLPEVSKLLSEQLDVDNFANLQAQLARAEAWLGRVAFQYRNAERFLASAKRLMLRPKSKDYTDMDRTIMLEADVRNEQARVNLLKDYAEALAKRLSLGQSMMAAQRQEMKSQLR